MAGYPGRHCAGQWKRRSAFRRLMASLPIISPVALQGPKGRVPWTKVLLREWAALRYPGYYLNQEVRLGPTKTEVVGITLSPALESMLRGANWYCDGIIVLPSEVLIIECKMEPDPCAVGQVMFYLELGFSTPILQGSMNLPMVPVVLFAESNHEVTRWARKWGCRVEIYTPAWIGDYLQKQQASKNVYTQTAPHPAEGENQSA